MVGLTLEIVKILEEERDSLNDPNRILILNLPAPNLCGRRGVVSEAQGKLEPVCANCITKGISYNRERHMDNTAVREIIDFFAQNYGTRIITINGRGDPFDPRLRDQTLFKISYARRTHNITSYVFTAGDNLDDHVCQTLAENGANVMISLYGNRFIDADFFSGKQYPPSEPPFQNQRVVAGNLRRLISYVHNEGGVEHSITRIGMNYVILPCELNKKGLSRIQNLKKAANERGIFFVVNVPFPSDDESEATLNLLRGFADMFNDGIRHSTMVDGRCQMGSGSCITIESDGVMLKCPYQNPRREGLGVVSVRGNSPDSASIEVIKRIASLRGPACIMRDGKIPKGRRRNTT